MRSEAHKSSAYAFRIDYVKDGYVYFRTVSLYSGSAKHGRDRRRAFPVDLPDFGYGMTAIGDSYNWILDVSQLTQLLADDCWGLIPISIAETDLIALLRERTCVKSPLGLYFDVELPRGRATGRRASSAMTKRIRERDGGRCLVCGQSELDGVTLENGHIMPYSRGWELSEGNLVTTCSACNRNQGNEPNPNLFSLGGIHHNWDPSLLKGVPSTDARKWLVMLSQNILVSRVAATEIPVQFSETHEAILWQ